MTPKPEENSLLLERQTDRLLIGIASPSVLTQCDGGANPFWDVFVEL